MRDTLLGRTVPLTFQRLAGRRATLMTEDGDALPLPASELPPGAVVGDVIPAFVQPAPDGQPVATTRLPKLQRGEVAFLTATGHTSSGALFDWGLEPALLVPCDEQTADVEVGDRHPIGLVLDNRRLVGTMRISEMLRDPGGEFAIDQKVDGEAWRNPPELGLFVILERRFVGLLPASEPHALKRGEAARFRVSRVLPDGRIELTLRGPAHEEIERDAERVLAVLSGPAPPFVNDRSSPEEIRQRFGIAKKAFKRAAGRLLKREAIEIDGAGFYRPFRERPSAPPSKPRSR